jgi:hypothetical protein
MGMLENFKYKKHIAKNYSLDEFKAFIRQYQFLSQVTDEEIEQEYEKITGVKLKKVKTIKNNNS